MYAMASSLHEATEVIRRVIHTLKRISAILYGSTPYICDVCGSYFLASGEVTDVLLTDRV
jgi:hypothetical protein